MQKLSSKTKMVSRKEQQAELLICFGQLISSLEELVADTKLQTPQTRAKSSAKFAHDKPLFLRMISTFCKGEVGHDYVVESALITGKLNSFTNGLSAIRDNKEKLERALQDLRNVVKSNILTIPCELDMEVFDSSSPFTSYLKIRAIVESANKRLLFIDPWLGPGTLRRYFRDVQDKVKITVVTKQRKGNSEFEDFIDLSKLYADEKGNDKYCLMYHPDLHDRYLQCDDTVYHLGGSFKDAGRKSGFTITKIQALPDNKCTMEGLISQSSEQYGPSMDTHPNN